MSEDTYKSGANKVPSNLRTIMKSATFLSPIQADEFDRLVADNGGYPYGVPAAREVFREKYEDTGSAWVRKVS